MDSRLRGNDDYDPRFATKEHEGEITERLLKKCIYVTLNLFQGLPELASGLK